jgi:hypothetical protein
VTARRSPRLWPRQYVFVFGHMRSYSTLLTHILGSHPEISGYTEAHINYRRRTDLALLRWRVLRGLGYWPTGRYLLDKLLHNTMHVPVQLRNSPDFRALILIRRPSDTLRSILRMGQFTRRSEQCDPVAAGAYYCGRIAMLEALAIEFGERALAFPAESLLGKTPALLNRIAAHLELHSPLESSYRVRRLSRSRGYSEYSKRILAGSIVVESDAAPRRTDLHALPDEVVDVCERRYVRCTVTMESWCPSFGFGRSEERPDRANILVRRAVGG